MTTRNTLFYSVASLLLASFMLFSCNTTEDPGPLQEMQQEFSVIDFDRLEMGNAFDVTVQQGEFYEILVRGDRRNIDDLIVEKQGSTLVIRFRDNRDRKHETYITITMPDLASVNFSGATSSRISGFDDLESLEVYLSGASVSQMDVTASSFKAVLSGASYLNLRGSGDALDLKASGASVLKGFSYPVSQAEVNVSGASKGNVSVSDKLNATASGASVISYRGSPVITSNVTGASTLRQD